MRQFCLAMASGEGYRYHRDSLQFITGDVVEALILDSFDNWTTSDKYYDGDAIWIKATPENLLLDIGMQESAFFVACKLHSLVQKRLLLQSSEPDTYALNLPEINRQMEEWKAHQIKF